jgi:hypothetical protein
VSKSDGKTGPPMSFVYIHIGASASYVSNFEIYGVLKIERIHFWIHLKRQTFESLNH